MLKRRNKMEKPRGLPILYYHVGNISYIDADTGICWCKVS